MVAARRSRLFVLSSTASRELLRHLICVLHADHLSCRALIPPQNSMHFGVMVCAYGRVEDDDSIGLSVFD
jgi:hypothetical protein